MDKTLIPAHDAFALVGSKHSTGYAKIAKGLLPPLISTGPNTRRAVRGEYLAILDTIIAEKPEEEQRQRVQQLVEGRKSAADRLAA